MTSKHLSVAFSCTLLVALSTACSAADPAPAVTVTVAAETPEPKASITTDADTEPADPESFEMPRAVGMVLQDAQDTLQSLGSYLVDQQDATGLDRLQVLDSNWKVCSQSPKAGKVVSPSTTVVLAAVKLDESCP